MITAQEMRNKVETIKETERNCIIAKNEKLISRFEDMVQQRASTAHSWVCIDFEHKEKEAVFFDKISISWDDLKCIASFFREKGFNVEISNFLTHLMISW